MAVPNHKDTVTTVRATYPAKPSRNECVELCNEVAWIHRGEGFGLGEKTSGTYGVRSDGQKCSVDGIVYTPPAGGPDQFIDVLGNAEGENPPWATPQWIVHDSSNRRWVKPIQPQGGTEPPEPPDPPPSGDYITRAEFETHKANEDRKYDALKAETLRMITELDTRVTVLEGQPPVAASYMLVADADAPPVGTSREAFHAHEIRASVVPKP